MLLGARDVGVAGPAARSDDEGVRGDARLLALLVDRDHLGRVRVRVRVSLNLTLTRTRTLALALALALALPLTLSPTVFSSTKVAKAL